MMRTPLPFAQESPTISLLSRISRTGSLPLITTSRYDHQASSEMGTEVPLYNDYVSAPDERTEETSLESQDSTPLEDVLFPFTEPFTEHTTVKGERDQSTDFVVDYTGVTELTKILPSFDNVDIPSTPGNHTDTLENLGDLIIFVPSEVSNTRERVTDSPVFTRQKKSEGQYFDEETFTEGISSSGEIYEGNSRETWKQVKTHQPNSDISEDEGYDWLTTHPPTPEADISLESFTADLSNSSDTKDLNFVLEASPTTELVFDPTKNILDDLANFDLKIMTTREGLQVDANDVSFDPGQIAKATSYEGSSYSTATRSATVTTWVDPEDKHMYGQRVNLTESKSLGGSEEFINLTSDTKLSSIDSTLEPLATEDVELKLSTAGTDHQETTGYISVSDMLTSDVDSVTESETEFTTVATNYKDGGKKKLQDASLAEVILESNLFNNDASKNIFKEVTIHTFNVTDFNNDTKIPIKDSKNKTKDSLVYEIPVLHVNGSNDVHLDPSMLIALSVCFCIVIMLAVITVFLWLCHRHRNRSKIYLSHEATKPRAFFTKPMNPALLPNESSMSEPLSMVELQRPRAPIMLSDDNENVPVYVIEQSSGSESVQVESIAVSVVNHGFDNSSCNSNIENIHTSKRVIQDPPKYDMNYKCESDTDSGIKVWSSTGSLFTTSPQLTHCSVPPPPYSSSVGKDALCLSVHSLPSLNRNRGQLNV